MNLDQQALNLCLYMYAMKDDIYGFKSTLKHIDLSDTDKQNGLKSAFGVACHSNSKQVVNHILETDLIDLMTRKELFESITISGHKNNYEIMFILLLNDKVINKLDFNSKLLYSINKMPNDKSFEVMKKLLKEGKYNISKEGDDIFIFAKNSANENLIEYLFVNDLKAGEQLPKERMYEIVLTKQEEISPIFLSIVEKLNINFSENEIDYLKTEKNELYILLEKKNLFKKLNESFESKEIVRRKKI